MTLSQVFFRAGSPALEIRSLSFPDIPAFLALQNKVMRTLEATGCSHHLKPRTAEDLAAHLDAGMPILGLFADAASTGQLLLSDPGAAHPLRNTEGYPLALFPAPAIVQSVSVDPGRRGEGFASLLLVCAEIAASLRGRSHLLAKVADDNAHSLASFFRAGFHAAAAGTDPVKSYPVQYLVKPIPGAAQQGLCLPPDQNRA